MLVELSSTGGITPVHFVPGRSARRNLDFVHASSFNRNARISINMASRRWRRGTGPRDVYVYVKTTQHAGRPFRRVEAPPQGEERTPGPVAPPVNGRAREKGPAVYQKTVFESLRDAWPTYEVHVYHDTGRTEDTGHGPTRILEPQVPFGYLVNHAGSLVGWRHALAGRGVVLDEIAPNFFHVRIPNNGAVVINTGIEAVENPPPPPPWGRSRAARATSSGLRRTRPSALGVAGLGAGVLVIRGRRRRARKPAGSTRRRGHPGLLFSNRFCSICGWICSIARHAERGRNARALRAGIRSVARAGTRSVPAQGPS